MLEKIADQLQEYSRKIKANTFTKETKHLNEKDKKVDKRSTEVVYHSKENPEN
jgi:hypothetical protein